MTEYDYSPGAVERYQEKLRGIGRWAEETGRYRPANPHLPTTPAMHVQALRDDRDTDIYSRKSSHKHRSRSVDQGSSRPHKPTRSNTYGSTPNGYLSRPGIQPQTSRYPTPQAPLPPTSYPQKDRNVSRSSSRSHGGSMSTASLPHPQPRRSNTMPQPPPPPPVPYRQSPVRANTTGAGAYTNIYYPPYKEPVVIPTGGYAVFPNNGMVPPPPIMAPAPMPPPVAPTKSSWLSKLTGGILGSKSPPSSPSPRSPTSSQQYVYIPDVKRSKSHKHKRSSKRHGERHGRSSERRYSY
ncbi:hypothetical protein VNI00_014160 [Paramarasmius palmivorus]|uniref:Uncharacterized protein n=1 Tax=Paramarasmius palmivorus TaxID=297713 RepID=A0AAW0BWJ3_9AGAR